jgi:hypothetical protein
MTTIAVVAEDDGHVRAVTRIVDAVLEREVPWLAGVLESCRRYRGERDDERWFKLSWIGSRDLAAITIDGTRPRRHGRIAGQPLEPEAKLWRTVLTWFSGLSPRPDVILLVRDLDGAPGKRAGLLQVRDHLAWPFVVVAATPEPEIEAWVVAGFEPCDGPEAAALRIVVAELSFDPTRAPHRLTAHPNDAPRDAKRVLSRLAGGDRDRELACLDDHPRLRERGAMTYLPEFLDEIHQRLVPCIDAGHPNR